MIGRCCHTLLLHADMIDPCSWFEPKELATEPLVKATEFLSRAALCRV